MSPSGLSLHDVCIHDPGGRAMVRGVSLHAAPGEAIVVIGETGCGKSLIAQALLGLLPDGFTASGSVQVAGMPPTDLADVAAVRRNWSRGTLLLPQEPRAALDPTMRVGRQLAGAGPGTGAQAALAAVDLPPATARAYPYALSGGMAQRVLVATALHSAAPVLVVDEPTKGLDPARVHGVVALLRVLLQEGRSLFVITHDPVLARELGSVVAVLREGRVVECRPPRDLFAGPAHDYTREWLSADPARWAALQSGAAGDVVAAGRGLSFAHPGHPALFDGLDITVRRGGVVALTGPSGAGKTTLGDILVGLQPPRTGRVTWGDAEPYRDRRALRRLRRRYGKLHQDPATTFIPHRRLGQQFIDLTEVVPGLDLATALPPLLDRLGLHPGLLDRFPAEVSGGEAQRLALARVLLLDPVLVVADEPTSRLDPIRQRDTVRLLCGTLRDRGIGLVLISHNQAMLDAVADDVVTLGRSEPGAL